MLNDYLTRELVQTGVPANDWQHAVHLSGEPLVAQGKITPVYVNSMIDTVHQFGPYMIFVPEIAVFHGRPGAGVNEICLSLTLFAKQVIFDDEEKKTIKAAFAFAALDQDSHVALLSALALLLQNDSFIALLRNQGSKQALMQIIQNY